MSQDVAPHAARVLAELGAQEVRVEIERLRHHPEQWVREEAAEALRRLEDHTAVLVGGSRRGRRDGDAIQDIPTVREADERS